MFNKTAVILFANLPEFEARAKSFCAFSTQSCTQKISALLTKHFYNLSKQTSADTFIIDTYKQKGKNFAERISNAFADVYAKGYQNVICIGNDCLSLTVNQLENAIYQTEKGKIILGPTDDGGAYLIGLPKVYFNKTAFASIKWQSKKTYQELKNIYQSVNNIIIESERLADLDDENSFQKLNSTNNPLVKVITNLIKSFFSTISEKINQFQSDFIKVDALSLKSPPAIS